MARVWEAIGYGLAVLLWSSTATAQQSGNSKLGRLMEMAGCWEIEGRELNSEGETFRQTGIGWISVDRAKQSVRLDERFIVQEATGYYTSLKPERQFSEVFYQEAGNPLLFYEDPAAEDPRATRRSVSLSSKGDTVFMHSLFHHPRRGIDLFARTTLRIVSNDRIEGSTQIQDTNGPFREFYVQIWKRITPTDPRCRR